MNIKELFQRNTPVFLIGGLTILIFIFIIFTASARPPTTAPELIELDQEELIAPHTYTRGDFNAPVTLVEFTDFGCPACQAYHPIVEEIVDEYPDVVRHAVRHFPLPQHKDADKAAAAAHAAGEQGVFFEYSDLLFANQNAFGDDDLKRYADILGMDLEKFQADLKDKAYEDIVDEDVRYGRGIGINSTPTFLLNGKQLRLRNFNDLKVQVENALEEAGINLDPTAETDALLEEASESAEKETAADIHSKVDERFGTLEIAFTEGGFSPENTQGYAGQLVRWTNSTENDITFVQLNDLFEDLADPFIIKAGETFEYRLELRESGLWTYQNEGDTGRASIFVNRLPDDLANLLEDE